MEAAVRALFRRYESNFNQAIRGSADLEEAASFYASEFIAASPAGVAAGKNDDSLAVAMRNGYARYRKIGTKEMRIEGVDLTVLDELHCLARVSWTSVYERSDQPDVTIAFDVHYLVQTLDGHPKIFGWVTGDEQALLKKHGIG